MLARKIYGPIAALIASIALLPANAPSAPRCPVDTLPAHRVVTFHSASHLRLNDQPIEAIVQSMRTKQSLPLDSGITIHTKQYRAQEGVVISKNDSTVFIFARGFEPRPCAARAAHLYENHVIPTNCPVIGFDFDDSRKQFSFGQDTDIALLKAIYERILEQNPSAQIIIIGNCNGAKVAMELAAQKPKQLKALILLTPFISARSLFKRMTQYYVLGAPFSARLAQSLFSAFTAYDPKKDDLLTRLNQINKQLPIFIGQRMYDSLVPDEEVEELASLFKKQGNPLDGLIVYDPSKSHNHLTFNKKIPYRINRFLKQHNLPHNKTALASCVSQ